MKFQRDLSWEAQEAIKERKKLDRERRQQEQQRKKMQRDSTKVRKRLRRDWISSCQIILMHTSDLEKRISILQSFRKYKV